MIPRRELRRIDDMTALMALARSGSDVGASAKVRTASAPANSARTAEMPASSCM